MNAVNLREMVSTSRDKVKLALLNLHDVIVINVELILLGDVQCTPIVPARSFRSLVRETFLSYIFTSFVMGLASDYFCLISFPQ